MPRDQRPAPKRWGLRPYATIKARELLNTISVWIAENRPRQVDDPSDPTLADVLRCAPAALARGNNDVRATTLATLIGDHSLTYEQACLWYWHDQAGLTLSEIHYAIAGHESGGNPEERQRSIGLIAAALRDAAEKIPDVDPETIPDAPESDP